MHVLGSHLFLLLDGHHLISAFPSFIPLAIHSAWVVVLDGSPKPTRRQPESDQPRKEGLGKLRIETRKGTWKRRSRRYANDVSSQPYHFLISRRRLVLSTRTSLSFTNFRFSQAEQQDRRSSSPSISPLPFPFVVRRRTSIERPSPSSSFDYSHPQLDCQLNHKVLDPSDPTTYEKRRLYAVPSITTSTFCHCHCFRPSRLPLRRPRSSSSRTSKLNTTLSHS